MRWKYRRLLATFQSTLPARGATLPPSESAQRVPISIHAPRTGSDLAQGYQINPATIFQSTLPARGATFLAVRVRIHSTQFQSTLPARGATCRKPRRPLFAGRFQSTLPARGATHPRRMVEQVQRISIHAPRTGSDRVGAGGGRRAQDFNPRSPHGERLVRFFARIAINPFQSTLPARGATRVASFAFSYFDYFNPRSPHGERRPKTIGKGERLGFQSTLPARGATCHSRLSVGRIYHFNPRSPHGERRY